MASTLVYSTLLAELQAAMAPVPVVDWDTIDNAIEQQQAPFIALEELYAEEIIPSFGDPTAMCVREDSTIQVHCFVPAPESSAVGRTLAEQVQNALRMRRQNGVRVLDVSPPDPVLFNDGLWTSYSVLVDLQADRHVAQP